MQLRWTDEAASDLERIADYLFERTPGHAARIVNAIYDAPAELLSFPFCGRPGRSVGTRELVLARLPYIVVYGVSNNFIHVVRILHGAQKGP